MAFISRLSCELLYVHLGRGQFPARQYLVAPESGHSSLHGEQCLGCFRICRRPHPRQRPRHAVAHRDPFRIVGALGAVDTADVPHDVVGRNARSQHARQQKLKASLRDAIGQSVHDFLQIETMASHSAGIGEWSNRSGRGRGSALLSGTPEGLTMLIRASDILRRGRVALLWPY